MRNKKQRTPDNWEPSEVINVGLDVGFGYTKAVMDGKKVLFPSVLGQARDIKFQRDTILDKYPGEYIMDDDGGWFVGELALKHIPEAERLQLRGRTAQEAIQGNAFRVRMMIAALAKLMHGVKDGNVYHFKIATGLPVDHMGDAGELKAALKTSYAIKTHDTYFMANIVEVFVMPQPYGTIYANMLLPDGNPDPYHVARRVGVITIGTYTVDVTLAEDLEYIDAESGTRESGIYTAQSYIKDKFNARFKQFPTQRQIDEILMTGCVKVQGKTIDFREDRKYALNPTRMAVNSLMTDKWRLGMDIDLISLSGGPAPALADEIIASYPQTKLFEDSQFANALGYLYYANGVEKW